MGKYNEQASPVELLKKFEEIAASCNRCGFCTSYCPTYNATGNEVHSPRGRNQMFRALIEGKIENPAMAKESIDTCLLCGECTTVCFSEVPTAELMVQARKFLNKTMGAPRFLTFFLSHILRHPRRLSLILKTVFFFKRLGVAEVLEQIGFLRRFFPALSAANQMMRRTPLKFLLDYKNVRLFQEKNWASKGHAQAIAQQKQGIKQTALLQRPKVALMPLCGSQYLLPEVGLAVIHLLKKLKVDFVIPEALCCGLPAGTYGMTDHARTMAEENIRRIERSHFETLLVDDSSCSSHFKDYPKYLQEDGRWLKRAHDLSIKVKELAPFLLLRGLKDHLKTVPWEGGTIAYHDPCKAQYGQKSTNPPRELLSSIPRLNLVPIPDADQCCGGGGTYSFVQPELSQGVLESKIANIISSGCKIVVTSSASCLIQLKAGLAKADSTIEAMHLASFLVRALEKRR